MSENVYPTLNALYNHLIGISVFILPPKIEDAAFLAFLH